MYEDMPKCFDKKKVHTPEKIKILQALAHKKRTKSELEKIGHKKDIKELYEMGVIALVSDDGGTSWQYMNTTVAVDMIISYKPLKEPNLNEWI